MGVDCYIFHPYLPAGEDQRVPPKRLTDYLSSRPELEFHFWPGGEGHVAFAYWSQPFQPRFEPSKWQPPHVYCVAMAVIRG